MFSVAHMTRRDQLFFEMICAFLSFIYEVFAGTVVKRRNLKCPGPKTHRLTWTVFMGNML